MPEDTRAPVKNTGPNPVVGAAAQTASKLMSAIESFHRTGGADELRLRRAISESIGILTEIDEDTRKLEGMARRRASLDSVYPQSQVLEKILRMTPEERARFEEKLQEDEATRK